jgi:ATP-dependent Clp protease protease subunit
MSNQNRGWYIGSPGKIEIREKPGEMPIITGYAAVFGSKSYDLGGFVEVIAPGAFDEALSENPDVSARVQHQGGLGTIGRTTNNTLKLFADKKGLRYEVQPPNTQAGRDIIELVRRGDISKSSFAFTLRGDDAQTWDWKASPPVRTLHRVDIHDVSPVDGPAYGDTSVSVRAFEEAKAAAGIPSAKAAEPSPKRIEIYDTIGPDWLGMIGAKTISRAMADVGDNDPIDVHVNSFGGGVFEGTAIHSIFAQHKGRVRVMIDGIAASIASIIAMAGDEIHIASGGYMMIHDPWNIVAGNPQEMRKAADELERMAGTLANTYAERTGKDAAMIREMMKAETWFNGADEAIAAGFATHKIGGDMPEIEIEGEVAKRFNKLPEKLAIKAGIIVRDAKAPDIRARISEGIAISRR